MTYVGYEAFHCDRVSLLGIERPATMIFETHSRFRPPANCTQGNWDHLAIVSKAFVDDADLAAALASIGFNAAYSTIEAVRSEVSHQWRWTFDNATWSKIEILRGTGATTPLSEIARLAVWGGNVLTLIDMAWLHSVPDFPALVATGELAPGTLYAGDESATYVGVGDVNLEASATGKIQYRGDPSCDGFAT